MKKLIALLLLAVMCVSVAACGETEFPEVSGTESESSEIDTSVSNDENTETENVFPDTSTEESPDTSAEDSNTTEEPSTVTTDDSEASSTQTQASTSTQKPASTSSQKPSTSTTTDTPSSTTDKPESSSTQKPASTSTQKPASTSTQKPSTSTTTDTPSSATDKPESSTQVPENEFLWEHNYSEITITGYIGNSNEIIIPETINGKPVTKIKACAFKNFTSLISITIPGSIKTVSNNAFENCFNLTTVILEEGVEDISSAFRYCSSLKNVKLPNSVKNISSAFEGCTSLTKIHIPAGVEIMNRAFYGCTALTEVTIPKNVTELNETFSSCTSLKTITLPPNIKIIDYAFFGCKSLTNITIPDTVISAVNSFLDCSSLKILEFPDSIILDSKYYFHQAFLGCTKLQKLKLPNGYSGELDLSELKNLKELTVSKECLENILNYTHNRQEKIVTSAPNDWYDVLISYSRKAKNSIFRYYDEKLDDGTKVCRLTSIDSTQVPSFTGEEKIGTNGVISQDTYYAALISKTMTPVVIRSCSKRTPYINLPIEKITINGTTYPGNHIVDSNY